MPEHADKGVLHGVFCFGSVPQYSVRHAKQQGGVRGDQRFNVGSRGRRRPCLSTLRGAT